jgi:alpha-L-fucosidase
MGPHKDIVGLWQKAAQALGLRFGVSEHLAASFTWFQDSHKSDKTGPLAGVPYDGADPAYWDLYHLPAKPGDGGFFSVTNDPRWSNEWYARVYDLIDQYKPDLLYSDSGLPFQEVGRTIVAQLYNVSIKNNGGQLQAVYTCKNQGTGEFTPGTCVQDVERGGMNDIQPYPWQTDTSTGDWFYNKHSGYKSSGEIIHTLTDIVSKNGNLLLNVVQYPDGSLPPEMEAFLSEMAGWMKINGEAIFGTRPWTIFGEGPASTIKQGAFNDNIAFTSRDIRFIRKGDDIYASVLGLPSGHVVIRALAAGSPLVTGEPTQVTLLGASDPVKWSRTANGLQIEIPDTLPCKSEICFKISGLTTVADVPQDVLARFKKTFR